MQIPIVNGIYTDMNADYRTSYPLNLVPVPKQNGISEGYLRKADGVRLFCPANSVEDADRGGINWNGACYRVSGDRLWRINENGTRDDMGFVGGIEQCRFAYSFDRLGVAAGRDLYYLKDNVLAKVTSPNIGVVIDTEWVDGYFVTTDGEFILQAELLDPTEFQNTKYGSSEADPDPIIGLLKVRNELCAFNRYSVEVFNNVGGTGFTFARVDGAMMNKGLIGTHGKCLFAQTFAFVGSGKNEPCSVYLGANGGLMKIATRDIEQLIAGYTEKELSFVVLEAREQNMHQHLYLHLPNKTMVYDLMASQAMQQPIWFELSSSSNGNGIYRAINHVWCYNKWLVGDRFDSRVGVIDNKLSSHYGEPVGWSINTTFIYNGGQSGQIKSIELVGLTGRVNDSSDPKVFLSWTKDGLIWSGERLQRQGMRGQYGKRVIWLRTVGIFRQMVGLRFRGCDDSLASFTAVEVDVEAYGNG